MTQLNMWTGGTGKKITGLPEDSFIGDFSIIPDGTIENALIKKFVLIEKLNEYTKVVDKYFEITWKLFSGDFKNREVSQKIKAFSGKPEAIDRSLNMLMLVMKLADFTLTHSNVPTNDELAQMHGKMATIKIREWHMPKQDGSGIMEGNFVSEVHAHGSIPTEIGVKQSSTHEPQRPSDSALTRNAASRTGGSMPEIEDDLPF